MALTYSETLLELRAHIYQFSKLYYSHKRRYLWGGGEDQQNLNPALPDLGPRAMVGKSESMC